MICLIQQIETENCFHRAKEGCDSIEKMNGLNL